MDIKAVIFDIDGTLTEGTSWLQLSEGLGASSRKHEEIHKTFLTGEITYEESKEKLLSLWKATGKANHESVRAVFETIALRSGAEEVVGYLKRQGYHLCLITGSMDLYTEVIADKLEITDYYSNTPLLFDEGGRLTDYVYRRDQAGVKREQLLDFCARYGLHPNQCAVVGDGENDEQLFGLTGQGILLNRTRGAKAFPKGVMREISDLKELQEIF